MRERIKCDARGRGLFFEIHEGFIRACIDFDRSWLWQEVGLATRKTFNGLKPMIEISDNPNLIELELIVEKMKTCRPNDPMLGFFNLENFNE